MRCSILFAVLLPSCTYDIVHQPVKSRLVSATGEVDERVWDRLCEMQGSAIGCDLCTSSGWYGDAECDAFCPTLDPDCVAQNLIVNPSFDTDLRGWTLSGTVTHAAGHTG